MKRYDWLSRVLLVAVFAFAAWHQVCDRPSTKAARRAAAAEATD